MMKPTACIALLAFFFTSCHKNKTTSCVNMVTLTDGPATYSGCANPIIPFPIQQNAAANFSDVVLDRSDTIHDKNDSAFNIILASVTAQFTLDVYRATAPSAWAGTYTLNPADSLLNSIYESFNGKTYKCMSGSITVSLADSSHVSGTYTMTVFNATETKNISGTFNANRPIISY